MTDGIALLLVFLGMLVLVLGVTYASFDMLEAFTEAMRAGR